MLVWGLKSKGSLTLPLTPALSSSEGERGIEYLNA